MNMKRLAFAVGAALAGTLALASLTGFAGEGRGEHDEARRLKDAGTILPLEKVIERAKTDHTGRVIESELKSKKGRYVYELEMLNDKGVVSELRYDARSGEQLGREEEDD